MTRIFAKISCSQICAYNNFYSQVIKIFVGSNPAPLPLSQGASSHPSICSCSHNSLLISMHTYQGFNWSVVQSAACLWSGQPHCFNHSHTINTKTFLERKFSNFPPPPHSSAMVRMVAVQFTIVVSHILFFSISWSFFFEVRFEALSLQRVNQFLYQWYRTIVQ